MYFPRVNRKFGPQPKKMFSFKKKKNKKLSKSDVSTKRESFFCKVIFVHLKITIEGNTFYIDLCVRVRPYSFLPIAYTNDDLHTHINASPI